MNYYGVIYAECDCCGFLICLSRKIGLYDGFGKSHLTCPTCAMHDCSKLKHHTFVELTKQDFIRKCGLTIVEVNSMGTHKADSDYDAD